MQSQKPLEIKKYPNRRFYDATRSRHVTLDDLHDLVRDGYHVCITDSRTGDDITNSVLIQIILEKEHVKLDLFPASILHMIIRSNRRALRDLLERAFGPFMHLMAASQKQFDAYLRHATAAGVPTPLDWARQVVDAFTPPDDRRPEAYSTPPADDYDGRPYESDAGQADVVDELRRKIDELARQVERLSGRKKATRRK